MPISCLISRHIEGAKARAEYRRVVNVVVEVQSSSVRLLLLVAGLLLLNLLLTME